MAVCEELARVGGVADRGGLGDVEDGGQAQRVEADRECFLELPVDPQVLDGGRRPAQVQHERMADRSVAQRGFLLSSRCELAVFGPRCAR